VTDKVFAFEELKKRWLLEKRRAFGKVCIRTDMHRREFLQLLGVSLRRFCF
jgi:hypothetical protein